MFETRLETGFDGFAAYQEFMAQAEIFRDWGQAWQPPRAKAEPLLPPCVWQMPEGWRPQLSAPELAKIPILQLSGELLADLKPAGRPRKGG